VPAQLDFAAAFRLPVRSIDAGEANWENRVTAGSWPDQAKITRVSTAGSWKAIGTPQVVMIHVQTTDLLQNRRDPWNPGRRWLARQG
jgi:hypothetical protein